MPRYINYFLVLFLLLVVFLIGFLTGARWQAERPMLVPLSPQAAKQGILDRTGKIDKKFELNDEEQKIAEALEDPDFKRVHDHLMRKNPIQMNIPSLLPTDLDSEASKPMSEREPIHFSLPE